MVLIIELCDHSTTFASISNLKHWCKKKKQNHSIKNRPLHHKYSISLGVVCFRVYLSTVSDFLAKLNVPSELKFTVKTYVKTDQSDSALLNLLLVCTLLQECVAAFVAISMTGYAAREGPGVVLQY